MNEGDGGVFPMKLFILTLILYPIDVGFLIYFAYIHLIDSLLAGFCIAFMSFIFFFVGIIPLWSIIETIRECRKEKENKQ